MMSLVQGVLRYQTRTIPQIETRLCQGQTLPARGNIAVTTL